MTWDKIMNVLIVPFSDKHVRKTFEWIQDSELRKLFLMRGDPAWDDHVAYCKKVMKDNTQGFYAVFVDGRHAGNCGIKNIDHIKKQGEIWIQPPPLRDTLAIFSQGILRTHVDNGFALRPNASLMIARNRASVSGEGGSKSCIS